VRRLVLALAGSILLVAGPTAAAVGRAPQPQLTIRAQGAAMEFRTMNMNTTAFRLAAGAQRTFKLKPGRYVVVQAPPLAGHGLQMTCSDGVSANQYDLEAGERLTCTFIATPL